MKYIIENFPELKETISRIERVNQLLSDMNKNQDKTKTQTHPGEIT